MYTIEKNSKNEFVVKNSRFITLLLKIKTKEEINYYLDMAKQTYPKATHYCYAYKIGKDLKKAFDDNEPSKTAGFSMLNILEKEDITNVLAITIRYFGGIKLGAGGLIRAYAKSVKDALSLVDKKLLVPAFLGVITFPYNKEKEILYHIPNNYILEKKYLEKITYQVILPKNHPYILNNEVKILRNTYIEED